MARPVGSKNERSLEWEKFAEFMLTTGLTKFREEMMKLEGKAYIDAALNAMEFHKPRMARTELTGINGTKLFELEQAQKILKSVQNELNGN
jgi:hypothetical protein